MSTTVSPKILAQVEAALPAAAPGLPPRLIHRRMQEWSPVTVRHALRLLVQAGRAMAEGPECRRLYRRSAA